MRNSGFQNYGSVTYGINLRFILSSISDPYTMDSKSSPTEGFESVASAYRSVSNDGGHQPHSSSTYLMNSNQAIYYKKMSLMPIILL